MQYRKYRRYSRREDAAEIAREVILHGESEGWGGDTEDKDAIEVILEPYGIFYISDLSGTWGRREGE